MTQSAVAGSPQQSRRSIVLAARFWTVPALILAVVAIEVPMIIRSDGSAPRGGWVWPIIGLVALVGWVVRRWRIGTSLLLIVQLIVLWSAVLFPRSPVTEHDGVVVGLGRALQAVGAADSLRCVAAAIASLACILSFGRFDHSFPRQPLGIVVGVVAAAVMITACVPAGYGLRAVSASRVIGSAEQPQVLDSPDTYGSSTVDIGGRPSWSRTKIIAAQPADDRVIAIESGAATSDPPWQAIIGLRSSDGALLWRYRLKASPGQNSVGPAVIDRASRMIMVDYDQTLIGLDFDGLVHYRRPLAESIDPSRRPILIGDVLGDAAPSLQLGGVAVFGGNYANSPAGFATGYAVATGQRLWQYTADGKSCEFARAAGPGQLVYLLTGGGTTCRTELVGYDAASTTFRVALHAPAGYAAATSGAAVDSGVADVTPSIAAVGADRIAVAPLWMTKHGPLGDHGPQQQQVTQIFDSSGSLNGTLPSAVAPGSTVRMLPTPLFPGPASDLGVVLNGLGSQGRTDRWMRLSPKLQPTATTTIASGSGYQRVGELLITWPWGGTDATGVVRLSRVGATLRRGPQLTPEALPGCGSGISLITADDIRMAIRCGRTILVTRI